MCLAHVFYGRGSKNRICFKRRKAGCDPSEAGVYIGFVKRIPVTHILAKLINHLFGEVHPIVNVCFFFPTAHFSKPNRIRKVMENHHYLNTPLL